MGPKNIQAEFGIISGSVIDKASQIQIRNSGLRMHKSIQIHNNEGIK
jgi:hypothetical protein